MVNSTPFLETKEDILKVLISGLPKGYLYSNNEGINQLLNGFVESYFLIVKDIQKYFNDCFYLNTDNQFLDRFLTEYGLPNVIFSDIQNAEQSVLAITMMRLAKTLKSKEDYINFLALLGINVEFYHYQNTLAEHHYFPYTYPKIYGGIPPKNKLTWLVYINEESTAQSNYPTIYPRLYCNSNSNFNFVKNILDYLKPDYIIFKYITSEEKADFDI